MEASRKTEERPFEHFNVLIKKSWKMKSRRLSTRIHETVKALSSAVGTVQRPKSAVNGAAAITSVLRKRAARKVVGGRFRVVVCVFLWRVFERVKIARAAVPVECWLARVLGELFSAKWLATFSNCVIEQICRHGVHVFDEDVQIMFNKLEFISRRFFPGLDSKNAISNVQQSCAADGFVLPEQSAYGGQTFGAQKGLLNSFELFREKSGGNADGLAGRVLVLFWRLTVEELKGK